ncbi:hypothetical protein EUGRSUZ_E02224 [Eucalyptus grandis]|uniref:Uncharacterized protein n=1 Tax=Eucalyptus grandis TaxID=71139 RepID=A0ACC3KZI1_EUCGR|nr:hypothetical protein EUGRSUZ_E02224 [Eucalyptus grandis]
MINQNLGVNNDSTTCFSVFVRDESELIQEIVKKISTYLDHSLHVAKHPIGIYSRVTKLKSMLKLESNDGVLMVGLWGQGGIGKTCLAKALYNALFRKFEGACFLANVRETSKDSRGLVTLQETILNNILLPQQRLEVSNVDVGSNLIQHRLGRKKVLLILDDVDALCHLNALAGKCEWFGNGSRIIVTTRDKQLLTCHRIDQDHVYKVEALSNSEAHELLSKHVFQTHQIRTDLVDGALKYAKGLPLALEVLGSSLCDTTEDVWESTIKKLSRNPDKNINNVLKVSFDGLDENEKEIFLHIACFFKGWAREHTKKVLDSCDLETIVGLDILIKRSLISIEGGILQMHDLIQAMGMDIVNRECRDDPGRRSKLWLYDDVVDVLSRDMDFRKLTYMNFNWCKSLVHMPDLSCAPNLKELYLVGCKNLVEAHESLAYLDKLEELILSGCDELSVFPKLLNSKNLRNFYFIGTKFERFPDIPHKLKGLEQLIIGESAIKELPMSIENLVALRRMSIIDCKNLRHLPSSIYKLQILRDLSIIGCPNLIGFPKYEDSANSCMKAGLPNLWFLELLRCNLSEVEFLENLSCMPLLENLCLKENNILTLPKSINKRDSLSTLDVQGCHQLQEIPELPPFLTYFYAVNCKSLQKTEDLISIHRIKNQPSVVLSQGEMPQWVFPIEGDSIFFMVSEDLYDKILRVAFCTVLKNNESAEYYSKNTYSFNPCVNGEWLNGEHGGYGLSDLDHIAVDYYLPREFWGEVDFAQTDGRYIQLGVEIGSEAVKKWGLRIICKQLGDDLKVELRDNQLIDLALLYEDGHESTDVVAENSHMHGDNSSEADLQEDWQDCQTSTEEHSQVGSKRKHEFNPSLGKRIKTMLTSIWSRWRRA